MSDVAQIAGDGSVGPGFMFIKVPEPKTAKNRMHIDLGTADLDVEVDRVLGLGATLKGRYDEWGIQWATLLDPEDNEFCILRSQEEVDTTKADIDHGG